MNILYKEELVKKLQELIDNSEEFLYIVSPYFELLPDIYDSLKKIREKNVKINIFVRKNDDNNIDFYHKELKELGIKFFIIKQLHAKIYINEKQAIIGSINITENAFFKLEEIGGIANKNDDEYNQIKNIVDNNIMKKIIPIQEKLQLLENKFKLNIKLNNNNELNIKHNEYILYLFMDKVEDYLNAFKNGYYIIIKIESEKKINWIYKKIPDIKKEVYHLGFKDKDYNKNQIIAFFYKKPFYVSDIESLLELHFDHFEKRISFLIKAIQKFIFD